MNIGACGFVLKGSNVPKSSWLPAIGLALRGARAKIDPAPSWMLAESTEL
jgi:hypothetical protein